MHHLFFLGRKGCFFAVGRAGKQIISALGIILYGIKDLLISVITFRARELFVQGFLHHIYDLKQAVFILDLFCNIVDSNPKICRFIDVIRITHVKHLVRIEVFDLPTNILPFVAIHFGFVLIGQIYAFTDKLVDTLCHLRPFKVHTRVTATKSTVDHPTFRTMVIPDSTARGTSRTETVRKMLGSFGVIFLSQEERVMLEFGIRSFFK